jgi:tetratricopeptide (TPR) repeat protein
VRGRGDEHAEADLLAGRSDLLVRRAAFEDAIGDLENALSLYRVTRDLESVGSTLLTLGRVERERQNLESAARRITEGRAFAAEYQMRELEAQFVMQSALIAMDTDNLSKARSLVTEARSIYGSLSDRHPALERLDRLLEILPNNSKS